jgi:hypothetical protein
VIDALKVPRNANYEYPAKAAPSGAASIFGIAWSRNQPDL